MIDYIVEKYACERGKICMVGDRLDTDILFGQVRARVSSPLTLTLTLTLTFTLTLTLTLALTLTPHP